ncbi:MAG: 6-carboxytetrahydropterin synthase QueD [Deltaproteobacteria bacterium]
MFEAVVSMDFSAAHNLRGYKGKCEALHGHNWKVEVAVAGRRLDKTGMLEDFGAIKKRLRAVLDKLDHHYLNDIAPFGTMNPTSENIARWIFEEMAPRGGGANGSVAWVRVWETQTSSAVYRRP